MNKKTSNNNKKKIYKYTDESLQVALKKLKEGSTLGVISKQYGIPKTTLFYKSKGILKPQISKPGPQCILGEENEKNLVQWIFHMSDHGFPIDKSQLLNSVTMILNIQKLVGFVNNKPGLHWYSAFRARHPELTERMSRNLEHRRATVNENKIQSWFTKVTGYFNEKNILDIPASRRFNCDESAFFLLPKSGKVISRKGEKLSYNYTSNYDKENLTVLFCGNAAGDLAPPMVMFKFIRMPTSIPKSLPAGWGVGLSENGWMTSKSFYEWVVNIFYPWLVKKNIDFPVVLFLDSHASYLTLTLSEFCREKNIELIALLPNATHILQPLDVGLFRPLKMAWSDAVKCWRYTNDGARMKREDFGGVMHTAINKLNLNTILPNAFKATGLHPFTIDGINLENYFKNTQTNELPQQHVENIEFNKAFQMLEYCIAPEICQLFNQIENETDDVYTGPIEQEGLYHVWKKLKLLGATSVLDSIDNNQQVNE